MISARRYCGTRWGGSPIWVLLVVDDLEPTTEEPSSVTPQQRRRRHADAHTSSQPHAGRSSSSSRHAEAHTSPSSSPSAPSATPSSPTSSVFGRTHLVTTRWACSSSRRRRRRAEGQRTTRIRGKLFLLLLVTGRTLPRNAVLADVVGIRTRTPRHRTQGAQQ